MGIVVLTSRAFDTEGSRVMVNAHLVEVIEPHELGSCVYMASGKLVVVKERADQVLHAVFQATDKLILNAEAL